MIRVSSTSTNSVADALSTTTRTDSIACVVDLKLSVPAAVADWKLSVSEFCSCVVGDAGQYLRRVAGAGSDQLRQCGGRIEAPVDAVGTGVLVPYVDVPCVRAHYGGVKIFPQIERLIGVLSPGTPVDVAPGCCNYRKNHLRRSPGANASFNVASIEKFWACVCRLSGS